MPDLLVNLQKLPPLEPAIATLTDQGVIVRRARPFEISLVRNFIEENFSRAWADEVSIGFTSKPVTVYIATHNGLVIGFAAYECTARGFFGPEGVAASFARRGIGKALLLACLWGLREMGYVYGIIGRAGPIDFYKQTVGAVEIADSDPGLYTDLLSHKEED
jgi:predicted N-acetyltransferase YhbS